MWIRCTLVLVSLTLSIRYGTAAEVKHVLLVGQQRDNHPATTHEFLPGLKILQRCLAAHEGLQFSVVEATDPWPAGPELIDQADGLVLFVSEGARWLAADPRRHAAITKLAARGGGLSALHWGIGCRDPQYIHGFVQLFGACHGGPDRRYRVLETRLQPADPDHAIARGLAPLQVRDEFYFRLKQAPGEPGPRPLATALIDGAEEMVSWTWERPGGGRSFGFSGLHFHDNWSQEFYRRLVTQGVLWTMGVEIPAGGCDVTVDPQLLRLE